MHELALNIRQVIANQGKYTTFQPAGAVLFAASLARKRRKWLEILCDFPDPRPRIATRQKTYPPKRLMYGPGFVLEYGQAFWDVICENWKPSLRRRWQDLTALPEGHIRETAQAIFWQEEVEKIPGLRDAIGRDPTGTADRLDTYLFSKAERREFLIVPNADMGSAEAEQAEQSIETFVRGRKLVHPRSYLRWETDLGLTQMERDRIRSPNYEIHPRYDRPVSRTLFLATAEAPEREDAALAESLRDRGGRR